jgi:ubiquinone/menaquinone biosynthesis C-methylase UbiE
MQQRLSDILSDKTISLGTDGIYSAPMPSFAASQETEKKLRESIAQQQYNNYLGAISKSHSIPVMDYEVDRFLAKMPPGALILDVGGCWGWHWRRLAEKRPDVGVLIIDFVRSNLSHAKNILGPLLGNQVVLMHADATALPFPEGKGANGFDGVWTVQVYQHIPDFSLACIEAHRVLKPGGWFVNYSLHITPVNRFVFSLFNKNFHIEGMLSGQYYLARASNRQMETVKEIFGNVFNRYTECLFHPDLKMAFSGKAGNLVGYFDRLLGNIPWLGKWFARQRSFESIKE